jgi:uncharacterized membrane protein YhaH (DUF805 family)
VSEPPPGWSPYPQQPPKPSGMSNTAKFWIGVLLTLPVVIVGGIVIGILSGIGSALDDSGTASGILGTVAGFGELIALVLALVLARTRWFALGVIAGVAVLTVLAAGACVVLLVAFSNSIN